MNRFTILMVLLLASLSALSQDYKDQSALDALLKIPSRVEVLDLSEFKLTELPESIGKCYRLKKLIIGKHCSFEQLPRSIWSLPLLEELVIIRPIVPDILVPEINQLSKLKKLSVNGEIPAHIMELTQLEHLKHKGPIPQNIGNLTKLKNYIFESGKLKELPSSFWNLTNLEALSLNSAFGITLPKELVNLKKLKTLDLSFTQLSEIPTFLFDLTNLEKLVLSYNQIEFVPSDISKLKKLKRLEISATNITSLPESIGELENLELLELANSLQLKEVPESIGQLKNLRSLYIFDTLVERLPESLGNLNKLKRLFVYAIKDDTLPTSVLKLKQLRHLVISNQQFENLNKPMEDLGQSLPNCLIELNNY